MRERPILFNGPMVRAVLAGTKGQTRRIVNSPSRKHERFALLDHGDGWWPYLSDDGESTITDDGNETPIVCPYGQPGDRLWVRETWNKFPPWEGYFYAADDHSFGIGECDDPDHIEPYDLRWKPSIHMPREASRLTLEITEVRVERLNEISEEDAKAEGLYQDTAGRWTTWSATDKHREHLSATLAFQDLWESINGPGSWSANPWVWVIGFRRLP